MVELRRRVEMAEEYARTIEEQARTVNENLLEMQAYIQRQDAVLLEQLEILRALQEVISLFALSTGSSGIAPVLGVYIYILLL